MDLKNRDRHFQKRKRFPSPPRDVSYKRERSEHQPSGSRSRPATASTSGRGMASSYSGGQQGSSRPDTSKGYRYPQYLAQGAAEYLQAVPTPPPPSRSALTDDWNLHQFAESQGRRTVLRDESVQFFSNLQLMYKTTMREQVSRASTAIPNSNLAVLQPYQGQFEQENAELSRRPSNLPAYTKPNWYPQDDPYFTQGNLLGGKFTTRATYAAEMNRVPLRRWESTNLGKLMEADERSVVGTSGVRFTVMSYNVLSPRLLERHTYLYRDHDPRSLDWEYRCRTFMAEIEHYQPDIICLQEIDITLVPLYDQLFQDMGFRGVYKRRTRDKEDGCAIYYRESKFIFVEQLAIEYYQPHVPILDRDNIGLLIKLETKRGRRQKVVVGTTHLLYNPKRHDVKLAQVQLLLAELDRFSFCGLDRQGYPIYHPTIMTGDFNMEPFSPINKLIVEGRLQHTDKNGIPVIPLKRRGANTFIPPHLGISDQCQHYKLVDDRIKYQKAKKTNNFEIDPSASAKLVNVLQSDDYSAELQALTVLRMDGSARYTQSALSALKPQSAVSDNSFAAESVVSETISSHSNVSSSCDNDSPPSALKVDDRILDDITKHGTLCTFGSGEFSHRFNFRDVHSPKLDRAGNEGCVTTKQNGWVCVDYIYYSMVWNEQFGRITEGKLKLIRRLGLLSRSDAQRLGNIPQEDIPSDHFPLVAEFLLKN